MRHLTRRGLGGVQLVISATHEGLEVTVARVLHTTWGRGDGSMYCATCALRPAQPVRVAAVIHTVFTQENQERRQVAGDLIARLARLAKAMDEVEEDALAYTTFTPATGAGSARGIRWSA